MLRILISLLFGISSTSLTDLYCLVRQFLMRSVNSCMVGKGIVTPLDKSLPCTHYVPVLQQKVPQMSDWACKIPIFKFEGWFQKKGLNLKDHKVFRQMVRWSEHVKKLFYFKTYTIFSSNCLEWKSKGIKFILTSSFFFTAWCERWCIIVGISFDTIASKEERKKRKIVV